MCSWNYYLTKNLSFISISGQRVNIFEIIYFKNRILHNCSDIWTRQSSSYFSDLFSRQKCHALITEGNPCKSLKRCQRKRFTVDQNDMIYLTFFRKKIFENIDGLRKFDPVKHAKGGQMMFKTRDQSHETLCEINYWNNFGHAISQTPSLLDFFDILIWTLELSS